VSPTVELELLRRIEYWSHLNWWGKTKDAERKRNAPKPFDFATWSKDPAIKKRDAFALDARLRAQQERRQAELARIAARKAGVENGG
jgi:hypothetical protein